MNKDKNAKKENIRPLRFNTIWLVPLLALIVSGWMVYDNWADQGPKIVLVANTAEGIDSGKTKVKVHNVMVGEVKEVKLNKNFNKALITVRMNKDTEDMLKTDAKFWVVKPRVGLKGISGLGTVISGAYIEMEPGRNGKKSAKFEMMPQPPLSTSEDKGIRLRLESTDVAKMSIGTPVHFRGYEVGHIEKVDFDLKTGAIKYRIFIQAPYDSLVNDAVQFWLTPGFSVKSSAHGLEVRMDSLENLLWGGISFGVTRGDKAGKPVPDLSKFKLYQTREQALDNKYNKFINYVFLFDSNLSGLQKGAPVEFCGLRIGTVKEVPLSGLKKKNFSLLRNQTVPVLASIEPQRLAWSGNNSISYWQETLKDCIAQGLRGALKTTNIITGGQSVALKFVDDPEPVKEGSFQDYPVFPTTSGGFQGLEDKANALLEKLIDLKLEDAVDDFRATLDSSRKTFSWMTEVAKSLDELVNATSTRDLPVKIDSTLQQLNATMTGYDTNSAFGQSLRRDMRSLERLLNDIRPLVRELRKQPNTLIFDKDYRGDRIPPKAAGEDK